MELEFDKEIDALLRRERGRTIAAANPGGVHLGADEIAAFVENAVPAATRTSYVLHFAECDRCRRSLANAMVLNSEDPEASPGITAPEMAIPWYRRLFVFPKLAYVMGGLVVLFGGFIGISLLNRSGSFEMSRGTEVQRSAPAAAPQSPSSANSAAFSANSASNAANAAANAAPAVGSEPQQEESEDRAITVQKGPAFAEREDEPKMLQPPAPAPAATDARPKDERLAADDIESRRTQEMRSLPKERVIAGEQKEAAPAGVAQLPQSNRSGPSNTKGPFVQRNEQRGNDQISASKVSRDREADRALKKTESPAAKADSSAAAEKRQVSGRTFEFRRGAWYDTTYRGQGIIEVRRNTEDYRRLDSGLRRIAESFVGTVVTIWNGRAYRIQ